MKARTYTLRQTLPGGDEWESQPFPLGDNMAHVRQAVIAGYLYGQQRGAYDETGKALYVIDAKGKATL